MPRVGHRGGTAEHLLDGGLVICPAFPVAKVLRGQLPALQGIAQTRTEALELLLRADVQEDLHQPDAVVGEQPLEVVDFRVGAAPFRFAGEAFDALHQHAAIPGAVEHHELARVGQAAPEAVQVGLPLLLRKRCGDRPHLEAARVERPAQPADDAALAGGVPTLEHHHRAPAVRPVGERDLLQFLLAGVQLRLVLPAPDPRRHVQRGQTRRPPLQPVRRPLADPRFRFPYHYERSLPLVRSTFVRRNRPALQPAPRTCGPDWPHGRRQDRVVVRGAGCGACARSWAV